MTVAVLLACFGPGSGGLAAGGPATQRASLAEGERLPLLAWGGMPADQATPQRFVEMAEAGFTHTVAWAPDLDSVVRMLDDGHKAGIRQLISTPALESSPDTVVERVKQHPGLAGYYLRDEPPAAAFDALAALCRRIAAADPAHGCYINLLPTYATPEQLGTKDYAEYLRQFTAKVPTPMLSYDHYTIIRPTSDPASDVIRPDFYLNLELASQAARDAKRPLWTFLLTASHFSYPVPTLAHLRFQAYSNLAYGSTLLQCFTYWTLLSERPENMALIGTNGQKTATYPLVQTVFAELQAVRGAFLGSHVVQVGHTGKSLPAGTRAFQPAAPVSAVAFSGDGGVVSQLANENDRFLVLVNRDLHHAQRVTVTLDGSRRVSVADKQGKLSPIDRPEVARDLEPGDAAILHWRSE